MKRSIPLIGLVVLASLPLIVGGSVIIRGRTVNLPMVTADEPPALPMQASKPAIEQAAQPGQPSPSGGERLPDGHPPGARFAVRRFSYYSARSWRAESDLISFNGHDFVIRSAEELVANSDRPDKVADRSVQNEMSLALAKLLQVDAIDWNTQMVVGANVRLEDLFNYRTYNVEAVAFTSLTIANEELTVHYKADRGAEQDRHIQGIQAIALVRQFDGPITFLRDK